MAVRWIYDTEGKSAYYQEGQRIYAPQTGICEFCENGGWWYRMQGSGVAAYYVKDDQVFTPDGRPAFHYA